MAKKCFWKSRMGCNSTSNTCQTHPCPPNQCQQDGGTWIEAVNFEHFETVKSIVAKFPFECAVSVRESQSAFSDPEVACSVVYIRSNFGLLPESIKRLETQGRLLQESMGIMKKASEKLSVGESVATKLQVVLKRIPRFSTFSSICQVLNGDEDIALEEIPLLKYTPVTFCVAEGPFQPTNTFYRIKDNQ
jgi:hypothetical protein